MTTSKHLAPVVLFVYNRPYHTRCTVEALKNNIFAVSKIKHMSTSLITRHKDKYKIRNRKACNSSLCQFKSPGGNGLEHPAEMA